MLDSLFAKNLGIFSKHLFLPCLEGHVSVEHLLRPVVLLLLHLKLLEVLGDQGLFNL
jgi:hypothetical protein